MDNLRRSKIGIKSTPDTQFLSHGIADNTTGLTREDNLCQRTLQITLRTRIEEIAKKIAIISESNEEDETINPIIKEYVIGENLFDFLLEEERIPETINNKKIVYELVNYRLLVHVMPSACHEYTAACFNEDIFLWTASGGVTRSLRNGNSACTHCFHGRWAQENPPTISFLPKNIQCPPGRFINNTNIPYPTFTVEIAKSNETWSQLLREADERQFSPLTGVMVWLGVKIFPETDRMRVCLKERDTITGHGSLDPPVAITGYISTDVPSQATITTPKRLIYHGGP